MIWTGEGTGTAHVDRKRGRKRPSSEDAEGSETTLGDIITLGYMSYASPRPEKAHHQERALREIV